MNKNFWKTGFDKWGSFSKEILLLVLTIVSTCTAINMKEITKKQNFDNNAQFREIGQRERHSQKISEGQLVAGLMPCLIHGTEKEKQIAITLLDELSIQMSRRILPILIEKETNLQVNLFAKQTYQKSRLNEALRNAAVMESIHKYKLSSEYYVQAAEYADTSLYKPIRIKTATLLHNEGRYVESISEFQEIFNIK